MEKLLGRFAPQIFAVTRILAGVLFACHGAQKLFGVLGAQSEINDPEGLVAGIIEFVGGLFVAVGLFTRVAAFIASGEMAVAYFKAHAGRSFWPILNHGEMAVLYAFVFLFIASFGAGRWSIDTARRASGISA